MEKKAKAEAKRLRRVKRKQGLEEPISRPHADESQEPSDSAEEAED